MAELERKIAIIGAVGMLGHTLRDVFPNALLLDYDDKEQEVKKVDITQIESLEMALDGFGPNDWVVNAAAHTVVDDAETDEGRAKSWRTNEVGPKNLAIVSLSEGFQILHFSTAYVFDGKKGMYREKDETNPINTYGKHKLAVEKPILNVGGVVLRTDALYGPHGRHLPFVDAIIKKIYDNLSKDIESIEVVNDQIGSPTYTSDLAHMAKAVIDNHTPITEGSVFHAVNEGRVSRADLARSIIEILGLRCEVIDVTTEMWNQKHRNGIPTAVRPYDCSLDTQELSKVYKPRTWNAALREYLTISR